MPATPTMKLGLFGKKWFMRAETPPEGARVGRVLSRWRFLGTLLGAAGAAGIAQAASPPTPAQAQVPGGWTEDSVGNSVYLTSSGRKVGIGTAAPTQRLQIEDSGTNPKVVVKSTAVSSSPELQLQGKDAGGVTQYGNLYHLAGYWMGFWIGDSGTGTTRMVITSTGRVGIGTTNPSGTLHLGSGELWIGSQKIADSGGVFYAP